MNHRDAVLMNLGGFRRGPEGDEMNFLLTMICGALVYAMTGSWTLVGITGLIGGFADARERRR